MGMFDTILSARVMPDGYGGHLYDYDGYLPIYQDYQTKGLGQENAQYTITDEGRLAKTLMGREIGEKYDEGKHECYIDMNYTGIVNFYDMEYKPADPETKRGEMWWHEYNAVFVNGLLERIDVVESKKFGDYKAIEPYEGM